MKTKPQTRENIEIETTYKGEKIGQDFIDKNPLVALELPKKSEIAEVYRTVFNRAETTGKKYKISVSEKGISTEEL